MVSNYIVQDNGTYQNAWLVGGDGEVIHDSASMHVSLAAIPLSLMTAERVTHCSDLMDAAYCSSVLREHSRGLGHVPLIDHSPRRGEKIEFTPSEAQRYKERSQGERTNAQLKDDYCGRHIRVKKMAK